MPNQRDAPPAGSEQSIGVAISQSATWRELLTRLGDTYGGMAGLVVHDFGAVRGTVLDLGDQWPRGAREIYEKYSHNNPWLPFMWRERPGRLILGSEMNPPDRWRIPLHAPFDKNFLEALNLYTGIGSVLWDDQFPAPKWSIVIAILRSADLGPYTEEEVRGFENMLPYLRLSITQHPYVRDIEAREISNIAEINHDFNVARLEYNPAEDKLTLKNLFERSSGVGDAGKRATIERIQDLSREDVAILLALLSRNISDISENRAFAQVAHHLAGRPDDTMDAADPRFGAASRSNPAPAANIPRTWEDARALAPGLLTYAQARDIDANISIIDHLRDEVRGFGAWTLREPGLPRPHLLRIDKTSYKALYNWLSRADPRTGRRPILPPDLILPTKSETAWVEASQDEVRVAQRLAAQWRRQRARQAR